MPADDYTPTTKQVRRAYMAGMWQAFIASAGEHAAEFDRWLAAHDAQARAEAGAQALRDAAEDVAASRGYGLQYPDGDRFDIGSDAADGIGDWLRLRADTITQEDTP